MQLPESIIDRVPLLALLEEDWKPVSNRALMAWIAFYIIVLAGAAGGGGLARWIDLVFVPIHEGGHLLFSWLGSHWLMVAGGTFLQLFVPFALGVYFAFRREIPGTAFCAFFFFEQFLPVGIYMADSRSQSLQYVTVGDPDKAEHDFYYLFSQAGVLDHDTAIGAFVRILGWIGMLAVVGWLVWRVWSKWPARKPSVASPKVPSQSKAQPASPSLKPVEFGALGSTLETATRSPFWQWFHMEQTQEQNGVHRFQPNGPKFHSLCYVDVMAAPTGGMQAVTLGLQRKFVEGQNEPFARELVKSFLCAVSPERSEELGRFVDEVGAEYGGTQPAGAGQSAPSPRPPAGSRPSPGYLVFIGRGKRCQMKSGGFEIVEENVTEGPTNWLCLRVKPSAW